MRRVRSFLTFLILFCGFFLYFINQNSHIHSKHTDTTHRSHGVVEIPKGYVVPTVETQVSQDQSGTWLLTLHTANFTFTPTKVGSNEPSYNEGHAHLYINGEKINRLYAKYYNLGNLNPGENVIRVTLNSNNHGALVSDGNGIEDKIVVNVQ